VRAVVLTGADPAFGAGLDLREAGATDLPSASVLDAKASPWWVLHAMSTPVVGAINGPAVTGGLELPLGEGLALERARFKTWAYDPAAVEARRRALTDRGRSQL
jgi:enoyl-CoA hydratase